MVNTALLGVPDKEARIQEMKDNLSAIGLEEAHRHINECYNDSGPNTLIVVLSQEQLQRLADRFGTADPIEG